MRAGSMQSCYAKHASMKGCLVSESMFWVSERLRDHFSQNVARRAQTTPDEIKMNLMKFHNKMFMCTVLQQKQNTSF
jgi:hypothetical protein